MAFVAFPLFPPPFLSSFTGLGTENLTCFLRNSSNLLKPDFFFSKTSVNYSPRWILGFLRFFLASFPVREWMRGGFRSQSMRQSSKSFPIRKQPHFHAEIIFWRGNWQLMSRRGAPSLCLDREQHQILASPTCTRQLYVKVWGERARGHLRSWIQQENTRVELRCVLGKQTLTQGTPTKEYTTCLAGVWYHTSYTKKVTA